MNRPFVEAPRITALPRRSLVEWLDRLEGVPGAFCLESGLEVAGMGRWHFLGAHPLGECLGFLGGGGARATWRLGTREQTIAGDPLGACEAWFREWGGTSAEARGAARAGHPPFLGGAVGWLGFELGEAIDPYPTRRALARDAAGLFDPIPDLHLRLYDEVIAIERASGEAMLITRGRSGGRARAWWEDSPSDRVAPAIDPPTEVATSLDDRAFLDGVESVRRSIEAGDVYEVNLTRTHVIAGGPDPWTLHRRLRERQPVPYGALLPWSPASVVSASPERFLTVAGRRVETRPIKGTTARGRTPEEDAARGAALLADEKERAELAMIVDLERNDLGRVARIGSVEVIEEAALESYATVIHTVATVAAELRDDVGPFELLRATFPGGSITGAPKLAALETIARLEPWPRKAYTGALGWIAPDGDLDLAIAIRTVLHARGHTLFSVGGAVTWDSVPTRELAELEAKGRAIFAALRGE